MIGVEFRVDVLSEMSGKGEDEIVEPLDEAVRRGVLSDRGLLAGEDYRFYHAILRRVLYNNLPPDCAASFTRAQPGRSKRSTLRNLTGSPVL